VVDDGESGFVVPIGDLEALSARLASLRDDPALHGRLAEAGRLRMRERFSAKRMVDELERIYADAGAG
jgi:glycosyltransferase involved in cell wall biosynthesis